MKTKLLFVVFAFNFFYLNAQVDFQDHTISQMNLLDWVQYVDIGDLDGDGDMDVLTSSQGDGKIAWHENTDGQGNFGPQQIISTNGVIIAHAVDLDGDGDSDVLASASNYEIFWFENNGSGNFAPKQIIENYILGLWKVYPFDADEDGDMDVISTSAGDPVTPGMPGKIAWYENDGQGNFGFQNTIADLSWEFSIHVTDVDTDNDMDVITSHNGVVFWYENIDGQGSYSSSQNIPSIGDSIINSGDIDGDGDTDVVSADYDKLAWYENTDGMGNFGTQQLIGTNDPAYSNPVDMDADGDVDLLTMNSNGVIWYENTNGLGNFVEQPVISGNRNAQAGDIDGDGDIDVLAWSLDKVVWHENMDGLGNFGNAQVVITSTDYADIIPTDIDNDGDMDVAFASYLGDKIAWHENMDGQGNFGPQQIVTIHAEGANSVYAIDMDGDNDKDILSSSYMDPYDGIIAWYENMNGQGDFGLQQIITTNLKRANGVFASDIDGDGDADVLWTSSRYQWGQDIRPGKIAWHENDGQGNLGQAKIIDEADGGAFSAYAIDVDNDSDKDVVSEIVENYIVKIVWYENNGQGVFGTAKTISSNEGGFFYPADINGDGYVDLLSVTIGNDEKIVWYRNDGQGNFDPSQIIYSDSGNLGGYSISATDMEADGDMDLLSTTYYDGEIKWHENTDGLGNFASPQIISTNAGGAIAVSAADINVDGKMDVLSAAEGTPTFSNQDKILWHENMGPASINESPFEKIQIYPNPTSNILNIESKTPIKKIEIHNSLGQLVLSNSDQNQINLSKLGQGVYFVKIIGGNGQAGIQKVIKKSM